MCVSNIEAQSAQSMLRKISFTHGSHNHRCSVEVHVAACWLSGHQNDYREKPVRLTTCERATEAPKLTVSGNGALHCEQKLKLF